MVEHQTASWQRDRTATDHPGQLRRDIQRVTSMVKGFAGLAALVGALLLSTTTRAQDAAIQRGRVFAQANCARCHAIDPVGDSPLAKAPPFRTLHQRYPVENLAVALAEGIRTAHRAMPEFELDQQQINDLIGYLKSLER